MGVIVSKEWNDVQEQENERTKPQIKIPEE